MQQYQEEMIALVGFEQGMHLVMEVLETTSGDDSGCGTQGVQPDREHVLPLFDDRDAAMQTDAAGVSPMSDGARPGVDSVEASGYVCDGEEGEK